MFSEKYGSIQVIDHCLPLESFNLFDKKEMRQCFNWVELRPTYSIENNSKKDKM